jgi:hypothetical protein
MNGLLVVMKVQVAVSVKYYSDVSCKTEANVAKTVIKSGNMMV